MAHIVPIGGMRHAPAALLFCWVSLFGCVEHERGIAQTSPTVSSTPVITAGVIDDAGTVVLIPGIIGDASTLFDMRDGLLDAACPYRIEIIPWEDSDRRPLRNLADFEANLARARGIADRITRIRDERPDMPLIVLGNSGGGGLAIMAIEMLPEGVFVDRLILTAAAVSNDYDLSTVFAKCGSVVNFHSRADAIVGWGTAVFGTIDRKKALSAGHTGFIAADGSPLTHEKLTQIEWRREWIRNGHDGRHRGYRSRQWAQHELARYVAPTDDASAAICDDAVRFLSTALAY